MTTNTWTRTVQAGLNWDHGNTLLANVPAGSTLLRTRFAWGFVGTTSSLVSIVTVASNPEVLGICSVVGGTTPPDPRTSPGDVNPPQERWLWWEARAPAVKAYSSDGSTVIWEASAPQEPVDTKGMVTGGAAGGPGTDIYASWLPGNDWDSSGLAYLWIYASLLIGTP